VEVLKKEFAHLSFTYSIGGQISFDVFPTGEFDMSLRVVRARVDWRLMILPEGCRLGQDLLIEPHCRGRVRRDSLLRRQGESTAPLSFPRVRLG
jgi:hypothetical protein